MCFGIVLGCYVENVTLLDLDRVCAAAVVLNGRPVQLRVFGIGFCAIFSIGFTDDLARWATLPEDDTGSTIVKMGLHINNVTWNVNFPAGRGTSQSIGFWDLRGLVLISSHKQSGLLTIHDAEASISVYSTHHGIQISGWLSRQIFDFGCEENLLLMVLVVIDEFRRVVNLVILSNVEATLHLLVRGHVQTRHAIVTTAEQLCHTGTNLALALTPSGTGEWNLCLLGRNPNTDVVIVNTLS